MQLTGNNRVQPQTVVALCTRAYAPHNRLPAIPYGDDVGYSPLLSKCPVLHLAFRGSAPLRSFHCMYDVRLLILYLLVITKSLKAVLTKQATPFVSYIWAYGGRCYRCSPVYCSGLNSVS